MSGPARKRALLVGIGVYDDPHFAALPCAAADVQGLGTVLGAKGIGAFDQVERAADLDAAELRQKIHDFLDAGDRDELTLVYISGHGVRDAATGEFHFIARDTDSQRITQTAVPAGFLNDRLNDCPARERILILDCCHSGAFAVGLSTKGATARRMTTEDQRQSALLATRGVIVLSSSRAVEASYAGPEPDAPSLFTGQLIAALDTGAADLDRDGRISATELYDHVNSKLRARDRSDQQIPVLSAVGVDGPIYLAKAPLARNRPRFSTSSSRPDADRTPHRSSTDQAPSLSQLVDYYRECVRAENADEKELVFPRSAAHYVCVTGVEQMLSAAGSDDEGLLSIPPEVTNLAERAAQERLDLVYGYPVVVLHKNRQGQALRTPQCAPLLLRQLEIVQSAQQTLKLRPYGEPEINPRLARMWVGEEEAENLRLSYSPNWIVGEHDTMARDLRILLRESFELHCVEELRPQRLGQAIDVSMPLSGARNTAVMMTVKSAAAVVRLLDDLSKLKDRCAEPGELETTALGALTGTPTAARGAEIAQMTLSPLNPAQRDVVASAMTRPLTVATGPPGTGKSALVVNVVATAVGAGQTVLVASTNNRAVDEVWERCAQAVPGLLVRTGSTSGEIDYRKQEQIALRGLLELSAPGANTATWQARHTVATGEYRDAMARFADHARLERNLLEAGRKRQDARRALPRAAESVATRLSQSTDEDLERCRAIADRLVKARVFGTARRRRFLRSVGIELAPEPADGRQFCAAVGALAGAESRWRGLRSVPLDDDATLAGLLARAERNLAEASAGLVDARVRQAAMTGRSRIQELLDAVTHGRQDWPQTRHALPAAPAWAVTCLSAKRFPRDPCLFDLVVIDEASQCSIAAVLPLLMRAKRALVIGDPLQLSHIAQLQPQQEAQIRDHVGINPDWLREHRCSHREYSAFHALEQAAGGSIPLHEHYRCHPEIARIANEMFYTPRDRPLTVLTRTDALQRRPDQTRAIQWIDVPGRAYRHDAGSWVNDDEIERVNKGVAWLLQILPAAASIGVVTPFSAQATRIERNWAVESRVKVGTAHRFQGGECDAVLFSLVAAEGMRDGGLGFLERNPNLWNVAITRARSQLFVVGDRRYWLARGGLGRSLLEVIERPSGTAATSEVIAPGIPADLLYTHLDPGPAGKIDLAVPCDGYTADAVVTIGDRRTAILLDLAAPTSEPLDRHLRLQLIRAALLASAEGDLYSARLPAWQLFDEDRRLPAA